MNLLKKLFGKEKSSKTPKLEVPPEKVKELNSKLFTAAKDGHTELVRDLIKQGADVNARDVIEDDMQNAFLWAFSGIELEDEENGPSGFDNGTALIMAAEQGHAEIVKLLLEEGADVDSRVSFTRTTALMMAAEKGNHEIISILREYNSDPNVRDADGFSPLMWASQNGYPEVVRVLIDAGASINALRIIYPNTAMELSSQGIMIIVPPEGAEIGGTSLMMAAEKGHTEVVKLLIERGADINIKRPINGSTALMTAAAHGNVDIIKLFLRNGVEVDAKNEDGITALFFASQNGHFEVVRLLLEKGVDVNAETNSGVTAAGVAKIEGHNSIVQLLESTAWLMQLDES